MGAGLQDAVIRYACPLVLGLLLGGLLWFPYRSASRSATTAQDKSRLRGTLIKVAATIVVVLGVTHWLLSKLVAQTGYWGLVAGLFVFLYAMLATLLIPVALRQGYESLVAGSASALKDATRAAASTSFRENWKRVQTVKVVVGGLLAVAVFIVWLRAEGVWSISSSAEPGVEAKAGWIEVVAFLVCAALALALVFYAGLLVASVYLTGVLAGLGWILISDSSTKISAPLVVSALLSDVVVVLIVTSIVTLVAKARARRQALPEPVKPEPVKPEPVKPEPVKPEPVKPEPVNWKVVPRLGPPPEVEVGLPDAPILKVTAVVAKRTELTADWLFQSGRFGYARELVDLVRAVSRQSTFAAAVESLLAQAPDVGLGSLRFDVGQALISGLSLHEKLAAAAQATVDGPDPVQAVELPEATITAIYRPSIELLRDAEVIAALDFMLKVVVATVGLKAHIERGSLVRVEAEECSATGELRTARVRIANLVDTEYDRHLHSGTSVIPLQSRVE